MLELAWSICTVETRMDDWGLRLTEKRVKLQLIVNSVYIADQRWLQILRHSLHREVRLFFESEQTLIALTDVIL